MSRLDISENLKLVRANIAAACEKAGRDPGEVLLIGATKMNDASRVQEAIAAGLTACGENRDFPQDAAHLGRLHKGLCRYKKSE